MRIIKYLLFLVILLTFALIIYIATQQKIYTFSKSINISLDTETVLEDLKNPENWKNWLPLDSLNIAISKNKNHLENFWLKDGNRSFEINTKNNSITVSEIINEKKILTKWTIESENQFTKIQFKNQISLSFTEKLNSFFGKSIQYDIQKKLDYYAKKLDKYFFEYYLYHLINVDKVVGINLNLYYQKSQNNLKLTSVTDLQDLLEAWYIKDTLLKKINYNKNPYVQLSAPNLVLNENILLSQEVLYDSLSQKSYKFLNKNLRQKVLRVRLVGNSSFIPKAIKEAKNYYSEQNLEINTDYYWIQFKNDTRLLPPNKWEFILYIPYKQKNKTYISEPKNTNNNSQEQLVLPIETPLNQATSN